jgi:Leucine-rich repeat (LRR) protein
MLRQSARRIVLSGVIAGLTLALTGCPLVGGGAAFIRDAALDSAIRAELGKPLGILSQADLLDVTEINASGLNIQTLDGIEGCRNLTLLDLRSNNVRSITPLENLVNLRVLDLGNNNLTQITAISGLFLLEEVTLSGPNMDIVDWSPLSANATNGGLGAGDLVILPVNTTLDSEGQVMDYWEQDYLTLLDLGVTVLFDEMGTTGETTGT